MLLCFNLKELVRLDDGTPVDPNLNRKTLSGILFYAIVGGLLHRGGPTLADRAFPGEEGGGQRK